MRLLAVDPAARPSAAQARDLLAAVATGQTVPEAHRLPPRHGCARRGGPSGPSTRPGPGGPGRAAHARRRRTPLLIGAVLAVLAIGGGATAFALTRGPAAPAAATPSHRGGAYRRDAVDPSAVAREHRDGSGYGVTPAPRPLRRRAGSDRPGRVHPELLRVAARQPRCGVRAARAHRAGPVGRAGQASRTSTRPVRGHAAEPRQTGDNTVSARVQFVRKDGTTSNEAYSFMMTTAANGSTVMESFSH